MKRVECEGVGDNDGFFEIGAEVAVSETARCSTAELATELRQIIAAAASMLERRGNPSRDEVAKDLRDIGGRAIEVLGR